MATLFDNKQPNADLVATHEAQLEELYAQIGRLTAQVAWLKKNLAASLPRDERLKLVKRQDA